jgi:hypothetical protein
METAQTACQFPKHISHLQYWWLSVNRGVGRIFKKNANCGLARFLLRPWRVITMNAPTEITNLKNETFIDFPSTCSNKLKFVNRRKKYIYIFNLN